MKLDYFKTEDFHSALRIFFQNLNIPVNYIAEEPVRPQEILSATYKPDHEAFRLMNDVYFLGMVDDAAFAGSASLAPEKIQSDYDGILIFGVTLHPRGNGLLPTRSQLAGITRAFNREYHYTPVVVVFKYDNHIAFANAERLKYKQEWREGEKAGKVSLLRDVDPVHPHSGHLRILSELAISRSGKKAINSFADLYSYWQTVFNVSLLNKKFYEELSNWYFWAIKEVTFPSEPSMESLVKEIGKADEAKLQELKQEHNAKNVIRLLTRFLFVWFIKEKKLIPEELFDSEFLQKEILKDLSPLHEYGLFKSANIQSHYYKAILQNLFFATLNCPIKSERGDKRSRGFSKANFGVLYLMRYESCFKNTDLFLEMVNEVVPFLNGGLFECLDKRGEKEKKEDRVYIDGFSDNLPKEHELIVPDYLFFGLDEAVDLSPVIGIANKKTKQAAVKGLINIFESYKFTIAENTPVEEDIALDPELLGKVFENLLASYNPETKTTARKQTGSFYTPREIVNYMVDESLIAYLKNKVEVWDMPEEELDSKLHQLFSFDAINPFAGNQPLQTAIIKAIDHCTVLDPACGSGAFPMGILQKMVHVLQKVDPDNEHWYELQMQKALKETESALHLVDREARKQKLNEIEEAFDRQVNDPDYARKLFLIEDCIYGVDIQPIAAQISKLRFFISLVVEQKVDKTKDNFGIRPLPNLETKFVAANTLVGIEKPAKERNLFENKEIKKLEAKLKDVRHRIFSIKTPARKRALREKDQELRERMGELLIADGWENKTAKQLSGWDPYDQNASSPFFDTEWMFGIKGGFDVVIGNPPYGNIFKDKTLFKFIESEYFTAEYKIDAYAVFTEKGLRLCNEYGKLCFITPYTFLSGTYFSRMREYIFKSDLLIITVLGKKIFESAEVDTCIILLGKNKTMKCARVLDLRYSNALNELKDTKPISIEKDLLFDSFKEVICIGTETTISIFKTLNNNKEKISSYINFYHGIQSRGNSKAISSNNSENSYPILMGRDFHQFSLSPVLRYFEFMPENIKSGGDLSYHHSPRKIIIRTTADSIVATIDYGRNLVLNSVNIATSKNSKISLESLLAILNSKLINFWYKLAVQEPGKTFAEVKIVYLKRVPLPVKLVLNDNVLKLLSMFLLHINNRENKTFGRIVNIIDGIIFQLYFPDHIIDERIDILQFVEKDLAEVMQGREFEQLPGSEKENIINKLHDRWTHPDSEVRNRIKLFAVRSPDILKPILESR